MASSWDCAWGPDPLAEEPAAPECEECGAPLDGEARIIHGLKYDPRCALFTDGLNVLDATGVAS